ncbi:basal cell adhesion molecule-like [Parambassis ranga]|uniref:Basal cell adhesion molecule-like n=1 Tax=Parambassis ranga TaxID=210632 RepID=A0A6P7HZ02_9TELE|nr:basal cell adhesion molecule-like [Parambassis ranga]
MKASVILEEGWTQIFSGETITLRCDIQGAEGTQWTYQWKPDKFNIYPTSNKIRIKVTESDSGEYRCLGRRDTFSSTEWSEALRLTVSDKPQASLNADKTVLPAGGSVTLTCSVKQSSGWKYFWYRDQKSSEPLTTQEAVSLSDQQIRVSKEGEYWCRGGRGGRGGDPLYYTECSQSVKINTLASIRPVVTLQPNWTQIYEGEKISVRCEIQGGDTEWGYEWKAPDSNKPSNQNEYRISCEFLLYTNLHLTD